MKLNKKLRDGGLIAAGVLLMSLSFNLFFVPNAIAPGGITGLATILHVLWGWPVGLLSALLNVPLFLLGWRRMGRGFAIRSILAMLLFSVLLDALPEISLTEDVLLASIAGGVLLGAGLALVLMGNASTGGTDLTASILARLFPHLSFGWLLLLIESGIVLISAFTLGTEITLYAVAALFVSSRLIDLIQSGLQEGRLFFVVTERAEKISTSIMKLLNRGVTLLEGQGAYSGQHRGILFCVVARNQVFPFKRLVYKIDPGAFVVLANVSEIMGEGFSRLLPQSEKQ